MVPRIALLFAFWTITVAAGFVLVPATCSSCCDFEYVALVICSESLGATVNPVLDVPPLDAAWSVTVVVADTPLPCTGNETEDCPAATVTVEGNLADFVSLADNVTTTPPDGAAWFSATVAVVTTPGPTIVHGLSVKLIGTGSGKTVKIADCPSPLT